MELIGTPDLCYINKVCVLISLYTLLGPLTEWGPGQNALVAPPSRRPWLILMIENCKQINEMLHQQ